MKDATSISSTCTIQRDNGAFCDAPRTPLVPYPVCKRHAIVIYESMRDELGRISGNSRSPKEIENARAAELKSKRSRAVVYYLSINGVIKIGTSTQLLHRINSLRGFQHDVLAVEPGHFDVERMRHEQFKDLRIGAREDFRVAPQLMDHIEAMKQIHGAPNFRLGHVVFLETSQ